MPTWRGPMIPTAAWRTSALRTFSSTRRSIILVYLTRDIQYAAYRTSVERRSGSRKSSSILFGCGQAENGAERPSAKTPLKLTCPPGSTVYSGRNVRKWHERVVTARANSACPDATTPPRIPPGRHAVRRTVATDIDWISDGVSEPWAGSPIDGEPLGKALNHSHSIVPGGLDVMS